jgi:hypothetical protein
MTLTRPGPTLASTSAMLHSPNATPCHTPEQSHTHHCNSRHRGCSDWVGTNTHWVQLGWAWPGPLDILPHPKIHWRGERGQLGRV